MSSTLQQNIRRLSVEHPALQRLTVAAIFKTLGQHSIYLSREGAATLQELLSSRFKVAGRKLPITPAVQLMSDLTLGVAQTFDSSSQCNAGGRRGGSASAR